VTVVLASYYVLFAVMGAFIHALVIEWLACRRVPHSQVTGFRWSLWVVVVALRAHGVFDLIHASDAAISQLSKDMDVVAAYDTAPALQRLGLSVHAIAPGQSKTIRDIKISAVSSELERGEGYVVT
jgi:hypothetical protein